MPTTTDDILTPEDVATLLHVSLRWVYEKCRRRQRNPLPVYRPGRYLRFSQAAILKWLEGTANPAHKKAAHNASKVGGR